MFWNMFPKSHGFVAILVTSCIKDTCSNLSLSIFVKETKLFDLVTDTARKPWLSGNMLPNIKTFGNGWSNFSENMKIVALKLLVLTGFSSPNLLIYCTLLQFCAVLGVSCYVHIFKLTASSQSICREVYALPYKLNY